MNKNNNNYLDIAYITATENFGNNSFEFKKLYKLVAKAMNINITDFEKNLLASFYTDLLQDVRFVLLGSNKWTLRDSINIQTYQKIKDSMFANNLDNIDLIDDGFEINEKLNSLDDSNEGYEVDNSDDLYIISNMDDDDYHNPDLNSLNSVEDEIDDEVDEDLEEE